jgi:hypothetical protein
VRIGGYISFFKINKCGTYTFTKKGPFNFEPAEFLNALEIWREGKDFENTLPWSPKKNKPQLRLLNISHSPENGDYLLTFIKSDQDSSSEQVGIVEGERKVIKRSDDHNGKKVTWGKPCYYWFIPSLDIIASIKFDHSRCDSKLLQDWVCSTVKARMEVPGAEKRTTENNYVQFVYSEETESAPQENKETKTQFLFDISIKSVKTKNTELQKLASEVTHIITRERIELIKPDNRPYLLKTLSKIPKILDRSADKQSKLNRMVEFRIEASPNVEDIKEIIEGCSLEISPDDREHTNVGFMTRSGKVKWSDEYRLTKDISIDNGGQPIIPCDVLLKKLQSERTLIIPMLIEDESEDEKHTNQADKLATAEA